MNRILICGSRDWSDDVAIELVIRMLIDLRGHDLVIVDGGARGADRMARAAASKLGLASESHPADWVGQGRAAGAIRNREMLNSGIALVVAFKADFDHTLRFGGTENMVRIARGAGVPTVVIRRREDIASASW